MKVGWRNATLDEIFEIGSSKRVLQKQWQNEGVPFYRAREIVKLAKQGSVENDLFISEELFADLKEKHGVPSTADLMVSAVGTLGACYVVQPEDRFYFKDASVLRFHPKVNVCSRFYQYAFQWDGLLDTVKKSDGATVGTLTISRAKGISVPLPPLEEQQRIVAVLDEAFEGLARARAHAVANLQNARDLFTANVDELLSRVGDDWSVGPLSKLVGPVATGPFGSLLHKSDYVENETPLVNPANIVDGQIVPDMRKTVNKSALERLSSYILDADDIVIGRRGEMGRCAVVEVEQAGWLCGTGSFFIRPNCGVVSRFVAHVLRSPSYVAKLEAVSTGATMANLSNRVMGDLEIALPNREQQFGYLEVIEGFDEAAIRLESLFTTKLQDLDDLRQSLLQKAFAGELT
ncbi:restriction endonuclease subunit S [Hwanghaeella sp. LZ110]|uniref:restriction endonuclease subunit S n=1 Tax=Hwanghaeella sp. LZ110 TaxID=3402810 RepID=UPI003B675DF6